MNEESKTKLQKLLMQWYEKGVNDAEAAMNEAIDYGIDVAIKAEREACAKVCEKVHDDYINDRNNDGYDWPDGHNCADAIRGRTE
jgi:hypothetical protein